MRKLILSMQVSLDGFVEGPGGEMDWFPKNDNDLWQDLFTILRTVDTFLLGGVMYPAYTNFWRNILQDPSAPPNFLEYARIADRTPHIVFSRTLKKPDWHNTTIFGNIGKEIYDLKKQAGGDMLLLGGAKTASAFINQELVDEYRLVVNPVVLGGGKLLFNHISDTHKLTLQEAKRLPSGAVVLRYAAQHT